MAQSAGEQAVPALQDELLLRHALGNPSDAEFADMLRQHRAARMQKGAEYPTDLAPGVEEFIEQHGSGIDSWWARERNHPYWTDAAEHPPAAAGPGRATEPQDSAPRQETAA